MPIQEKVLGQTNPTAATGAVSIYSPAASTTAIIKSVVITNVTASGATWSLYLDDAGTAYGTTTSLYDRLTIGGNSTHLINTYWPMNNSAGNLAVETGTADAINFTVFGAEIT